MCRLIPLIFFPRVVAPYAAGPGRLDGLAVDTAGARLGLFADPFPDLPPQGVVDLFPQPATAPAMEVVSHRPLGREVMGQGVPRTAIGQDIEDGVDDLAKVGGPWLPRSHRGRQQRLQEGPLGIIQVTGVGLADGGIHATGSGFSVSIPTAINPINQAQSR
jgi:hypothetical protein